MFCNMATFSTGTAFAIIAYPVEMRTPPTLVAPVISEGYIYNQAGTVFRGDSVTASVVSKRTTRLGFPKTFATADLGKAGHFYPVGGSGSFIAFDAEL